MPAEAMATRERNIKAIDQLDPVFQPIVESIIRQLEAEGVKILITDGYRSFSEQKALYDNPNVFAAAPGYSFHNYAMAIDVVPVDENGGIHYEDARAYEIIGKIAKRHGCEWGGDWKQKDKPHIQYTQGLTIEDVRSGKTLLRSLAPASAPTWRFQYLSIEQNIVRFRKALARSSGVRARALKRGLDRLLSQLG